MVSFRSIEPQDIKISLNICYHAIMNKMSAPIQAGAASEKQAGTVLIDPQNDATLPSNDQDRDIAIAIVGEHRHQIDPTIEAQVVRKIDWFLVPAMFIGYGLVYYDKAHICLHCSSHFLTISGNPRFRGSLWNDNGSFLIHHQYQCDSAYNQYISFELGNITLLFWDVRRLISYDICSTEIQYG